MKSGTGKICSYRRAFTLVEMLASLTVGTMVLIGVLALYNRGQSGAANVVSKLEKSRMPREIFQRIAEDLDRVVTPGQGAQIDIQNKFQDGFQAAKIEMFTSINDAKDQPQTLEKVVWQSSIDRDTGQLTLYRSHSGIVLEDALLDTQKEPRQREYFVPVCSGFTFFKIEIPKGETMLDKWSGETLPSAIKITLSFAMPFKTVSGTFDVAEEDKIIRVIAVDRTRMVPFTVTMIDANQLSDANNPDANKPADVNKPADSNSPVDSNNEK
jgi:hypothetical protein